jgi:hypothetical protein
MQHVHTFELLAHYRVEARLREAEHEAQLRLAREAAAARRPTDGPGTLRRILLAMAERRLAAEGVG